MELEITGEKENKALQRKEVEFKTKGSSTSPSRKELKPKIAALLNSKEELVAIEKIAHPFGERESTITVNVYESKEALKKAGAEYLANRGLGKKKGEEAKAAAGEGQKEEKAPQAEKGEKPKASEEKPNAEEKGPDAGPKDKENSAGKKEETKPEKKKEGDK